MNKRKFSLNVKVNRQMRKGEFVFTLDEFEEYDPILPQPLITVQIKLKAIQDLFIDYTLGNKQYGKELI